MEGLLARERPEPAHQRCPYCHDEIGGAEPAERVRCSGCHTEHHLACLDELGRCSVAGCASGPVPRLRPGSTRPTTVHARAMRERIQARMRRTHISAPPDRTPVEARLLAALEGARECWRENRLPDAIALLEVVAEIEETTPSAELARVPGRMSPERARELAGNIRRRIAREWRFKLHVLIALVASLLALAAVVIARKGLLGY